MKIRADFRHNVRATFHRMACHHSFQMKESVMATLSSLPGM